MRSLQFSKDIWVILPNIIRQEAYLIISKISRSSNASLQFSSRSSGVIIRLPTQCKLIFGLILSGSRSSPLTPFGAANILAADGIFNQDLPYIAEIYANSSKVRHLEMQTKTCSKCCLCSININVFATPLSSFVVIYELISLMKTRKIVKPEKNTE